MTLNRSGRETSLNYAQMKAGCIWQWSLTCGHVPLLAGQCRHAWRRRSPRKVIVHTDRGDQYCSADYQLQLNSMSAKGCCDDNACVRRVFHSMKMECIHGEHFIRRETMRVTVFNYIECDYNRWQRHRWCGDLSPEQFERLGRCPSYVGKITPF